MENSCRICLQFADLEDTIFEMQFDGEKFDSILKLMYPIEIIENDFLPQKICSVCQSNTITAYKQYKLCLETDKNLRLMLNTDKDSSDNEEDASFEIHQFLETTYDNDEDENENDGIDPISIPDVYETRDTEDEEEEMKPPREVVKKVREKKYICKFCSSLFITPSKLKRHLKVHVKEKNTDLDSLVMKVQDFKETPKPEIKKEEMEVEEVEEVTLETLPPSLDKKGRPKRHICRVCFKAFEKPYNLKRHMNVHNSKRIRFSV